MKEDTICEPAVGQDPRVPSSGPGTGRAQWICGRLINLLETLSLEFAWPVLRGTDLIQCQPGMVSVLSGNMSRVFI